MVLLFPDQFVMLLYFTRRLGLLCLYPHLTIICSRSTRFDPLPLQGQSCGLPAAAVAGSTRHKDRQTAAPAFGVAVIGVADERGLPSVGAAAV